MDIEKKKLNIVEALRKALRDEMKLNESIYIIGEDVRIGGSFGVTLNLFDEFGEKRVLDTPISELGYSGLAIGSSMFGLRPIVDFQFGDFIFCCMDQIVNQAAKLRYMSNGQVEIPVVFRLPCGNNGRGAQHAQCLESYFAHTAGLIVISVSTPRDAYGLLRASIRNNNPIVFFEHKLLYGNRGITTNNKSDYPEKDYIFKDEEIILPIGKADIKLIGSDITLIATHLMLHRSIDVSIKLKSEGIDVEIIDPRTLAPYDKETIINSLTKTGKLLIVEEENGNCSWGASLIADMLEFTGGNILAKRISGPNTPVPYSTVLTDSYVPSKQRIEDAILTMLKN